MIVKMKKIYLVILNSLKDTVLDRLRDLGVMHLEISCDPSERIIELLEDISFLHRTYDIISTEEESRYSGEKSLEEAFNIGREVDILKSREIKCIEKISQLKNDIDKQKIWGDFERDDLDYITGKGVDIRLYEVKNEDLVKFPDSIVIFTLNKTKALSRLAVIVLDDSIEIPFEEIPFAEKPLTQLENELIEEENEIERIRSELGKLSKKSSVLKWAINKINDMIEFQSAGNCMERYGKISHLTGYVPETEMEKLKEVASEEGWGLIIAEPSDKDPVPTIVKRSPVVKPIKPVFDLLGTVPGYKEFDISPWFLIFFSLFWGMIVGDAGYGLLFFIFTLIGKLIFRKAPNEIFALIFLTSITTIIWGGMSGNWFGVESFAKSELVSWMIVPYIASFSSISTGSTDKVIMHLCFIIGAFHLSVAHGLNFFRLLPSLKAISEIGRLSMIWGLYFLIRTLVIKLPMHPLTLWLLGVGFLVVLLFSEQEGKFFKGVARGFSNLILLSLGSVGFFSDVVSYVRLFAVGLATLEVAKSFNNMAAGLSSSVPGIVAGALILFFGHGLNIVLCGMSLIVHGVRLNMLEFSGHLGMEWSGLPYKPFKKNVD